MRLTPATSISSTSLPLKETKFLPPSWNSTNGEPGSMGVTNATRSSMIPIGNVSTVRYGDTFKVRVDAKDGKGRQRVFGGDYWRALLVNRQNGRCIVPGHVNDFGNGTYLFSFQAMCVGQSSVEISLVHTREAVYFLKHEFLPLEGKVIWKGTFGSSDRVNKTCWLHRDGSWQDQCEYRYKTGIGRSLLLCQKPEVGSCADLLIRRLQVLSETNEIYLTGKLPDMHY
ncbi:NXPE family member 1-like [Ptychodera flava]|uniref:NXPE family member 1-like n=1 Tax=Ptychodera flava TaxID=63121 RepID=UPI00396A0060